MPRLPCVPPYLLTGPFTAAMAYDAGLTPRQLQSKCWVRLFRGVYVHASVTVTPEILAEAVALLLPAGSVVAGDVAASLLGADVRPLGATDVTVLCSRDWRVRRSGIIVQEGLLEDGDVVQVGPVLLTSPVRTAFDQARKRDLLDGIIGVDAMLNRGGCDIDELREYIASHRHWAGVRWAEEVLFHAEPKSQSVMETRQRMAFVFAGFPRPQAQIPISHAPGDVPFAALDNGWEEFMVGTDYDGRQPHEQTAEYDNERQEFIRSTGWWHRRYTRRHYRNRWQVMIHEVGRTLIDRGWSGRFLPNQPESTYRVPRRR